jgi:hypothetical protein
MKREIGVSDGVDAVVDSMKTARLDEPPDADARVAQQPLELSDRNDAVLPSSKIPKPFPPLVRATCVTAAWARATLVINRFTRVARGPHGVTKDARGVGSPPGSSLRGAIWGV